MVEVVENVDVPQLSSEMVILTFMSEHEIPLQPKALYGGLINQQNITFSYRTVQNKISTLTESGDIKRVSIDTESGKIRELGEDERKRSYYLITDQGKARVKSELN